MTAPARISSQWVHPRLDVRPCRVSNKSAAMLSVKPLKQHRPWHSPEIQLLQIQRGGDSVRRHQHKVRDENEAHLSLYTPHAFSLSIRQRNRNVEDELRSVRDSKELAQYQSLIRCRKNARVQCDQ